MEKGNPPSHHQHHSKSHHHSHPQQDQVQAIYLAQASIFSYEARKSAKSWVPLCDSTVPISILYDNTRSIYRIISVDADIKEVVVNTTVIPELEFVKTTQKFGYWKDIASGRVFGIGFASEYEAEAFDECLRKVKQNIVSPSAISTSSISSAESTSTHNAMVSGGGVAQGQSPGQSQSQHHHVQQQTKLQSNPPSSLQRIYPSEDTSTQVKGHGDGVHSNSALTKLPPIPPQSTMASPRPAPGGGGQGVPPPPPPLPLTSSKKQVNWNDFDQLGPAVISFMNNSRQQQHPFIANNPSPFSPDHRPSTYKVDLPIIEGKSSATGTAPTQVPTTTTIYQGQHGQSSHNLEDNQRMSNLHQTHPQQMAQPSYHHHMPPPSYPQNFYSQNQPPADNPSPPPLMPLTMSIPPSYCYQGPPLPSLQNNPMIGSPQPGGGSGDGSRFMENSLKAAAATTAELLEEINRLKGENTKLSESLIESTCNAKKWELQVSSLREDNIQLVKSVADLNLKVDTVNKECREYKEQANRWKEHYQQAVTSAKEKSQSLKDAEDKLKSCSQDKSRIELVMKDLEEELKRQQQINKEQQAVNGQAMVGQFSNKYFRELEDHYKNLLSDSQKKIEEVLRKDGDRKNVLRGVDTLFTGAIQGLINIHGQIRQAYEQ